MWLADRLPEIRREVHYGSRVVRCFAERPTGLHALLEEAVAAKPDGEAVVCGDQRMTYRALDEEVGRVAAGLAARGVGRGDRVALLMGNRPEFVVMVFAAARLGAISVPLGTREQRPGLRHALTDCGACLLVHEGDLEERLPDATEVPRLKHRLAVGEGGRAPDYNTLRMDDPIAEAVPVAEDDVSVILYTSGTTGLPKGAMLTNLSIVHSSMHYRLCMALGQDDRALVAVPLSHVTGLVAQMSTIAHARGALIIMPAFKARDFLHLAARERMTCTLLVPAMYNLCLLEPDFGSFDLSAWRVGGYGGAPMASATIARLAELLPHLQLANAYGATETTSPTTIMPPQETAARPDSVGQVVPCGEVVIMDQDGREVPRGEAGEVWTRGPMVVPGYWNNPEATAREFRDGFWCSGDVGSMDEDGFLRVFDRRKDVINRGGYKIYSVEVENVLLAHSEILEAGVVARPCPVLGERVHAFVVPRASGSRPADLERYCGEHLADYKVPDGFTFRDEPLPRNANGKVLKRALRDLLME